MKKLPTVSSAASTTFVHAKVPVGDRHIWIDGNAKITAGNGSFADPAPNAFSLLQIGDCPHSTPTCRQGCYVHNLEAAVPDLHALYRHNSETIRAILASDLGTLISAAADMGAWIDQHCRGGFRWHVSGDVFSRQYANFISNVCLLSSNVHHWIYTRSFLYVEWLDAGNLEVNLSADRDNYANAQIWHRRTGKRICYYSVDGELPDDLPPGSVIFPDYALRGADGDWWKSLSLEQRKMICPVDMFGKSEMIRCGVCKKCM